MSSTACRANNSSRSASSSAIVAETTTGYHLLKIDGYSLTKGTTPTGSFLTSSQFTVGGHRWSIKYYPNGEHVGTADYISVFLVLDEKTNMDLTVQAKFKISFADQVKKQPSLKYRQIQTFNLEGSCGWGYAKFIKRVDFEKSGDLRDDSFTIRCDIVVVREIRAEETTEILPIESFVSVPPSDMNQHFGDLLETEKGTDVVFEVGGQTFAAHRCVLAARSPVFRSELYGLTKEGDTTVGVVHIEDMEVQVFKLLLRFVYTDSLPEMKTEEDVICLHLLVTADRYDLHRLKLICENRLCKYIGVSTVSNILALADQHHCDGLKKACFSFLGSPANLSAVVASDGFKHLSKSCPSLMEELVVMLALPPSHA